MATSRNFGITTLRFNEGIIVSGSDCGKGTVIVTGSMVISGSESSSALDLYTSLSGQYAVVIDNDESSDGHGLKVTSDGSGTGTNLLDVESGTTTVFRVRGDGKVGIGTTSPGYELEVAGDIKASGNLYVADSAGMYTDKIRRYSDSDNTTKILLNDELIKLYGGHSTENIVAIGENNSVGQDNNFWVSGSIGSRNTSTRGTAVFDGDVFSSGTFYGFSGMRIDTSTELHALNIDPLSDTVSFFKELTPGVDANWFVSGSIGGTINHAAFGGDLVVSGNLGIGTASPRTALDVVYDYHNSTFENQLANGQGGGRVMKYSPGADDTLTAGQLYFLHTDGTWDQTGADAVATGGSQLLGVGLGSARDLGVLLEGFARIPSTEILNVPGSGAVDGLPVYVSTTAGHFDFTAPVDPDDFVRVVGYAIDDDSGDVMIYFNPSSTWIEL